MTSDHPLLRQPDDETFALLFARFTAEHEDLNFMSPALVEAVNTIIMGSLGDHPKEWPAAAFTLGWLCARDYEQGMAFNLRMGLGPEG